MHILLFREKEVVTLIGLKMRELIVDTMVENRNEFIYISNSRQSTKNN